VARRESGFASGLDVCCHLSAMPLVLACLLERLVATENDWGGKRRLCSYTLQYLR
jgi:hypothetical protein